MEGISWQQRYRQRSCWYQEEQGQLVAKEAVGEGRQGKERKGLEGSPQSLDGDCVAFRILLVSLWRKRLDRELAGLRDRGNTNTRGEAMMQLATFECAVRWPMLSPRSRSCFGSLWCWFWNRTWKAAWKLWPAANLSPSSS